MSTTSKVKQVYQKGFATTKNFSSEPRLIKILEIAAKYRGKVNSLLDFGCGDGFFTKLLAESLNADRIYGVDISKAAIIKARNLNIRASQLDIDQKKLPYPAGYFDFIFCGNIIELVADADHLLSEVKRTLKPEGICIFTFPNIASWLSRIALFLGYLPYYSRVSTHYDLGKMFSPVTKGNSTGFIRLFNLSTFETLADLYGLKIIGKYGMHESTLPFPLKIFDQLMANYPSLASKLICVLTSDTAKISR